MLKDRADPVAPLRCIVKYAPGAWNCGGPNWQIAFILL